MVDLLGSPNMGTRGASPTATTATASTAVVTLSVAKSVALTPLLGNKCNINTGKNLGDLIV